MRKKFLVKLKYLLILKIKKMKNLQEMSLEEMRQTEGGNLGLVVVAIVILWIIANSHNRREQER